MLEILVLIAIALLVLLAGLWGIGLIARGVAEVWRNAHAKPRVHHDTGKSSGVAPDWHLGPWPDDE